MGRHVYFCREEGWAELRGGQGEALRGGKGKTPRFVWLFNWADWGVTLWAEKGAEKNSGASAMEGRCL